MSQARKSLKYVCFALFVVAAIEVVVGIIDLGSDLVRGLTLAATGVVGVAFCALGIRGANKPHDAGRTRPCAIVLALLSLACVIEALALGGEPALTPACVLAVLSAALAICGFVLGGRVLEESLR